MFAGFINSVFVVRIGIPSLIVTIGMQYLWRGLVMIACGGLGLSMVKTQGTVLYKVLVGRIGGVVPAQAIWALVIAIILGLILNRHRYGAHLLYAGDDAVSARMMGVNVERVKTIAFMQLGVCAAFVGVLATLEVLYFWPSTGEGLSLIHICEPTRRTPISYAVFCLKKKKKNTPETSKQQTKEKKYNRNRQKTQ